MTVLAIAALPAASAALARRYTIGSLAWDFAAQLWLILLLWLIWRSGIAARLRDHFERSAGRGARLLASLVVAVVVFGLVLAGSFPLDFCVGFVRERAYGFAGSLSVWRNDWLQSAGVNLAVATAIVVVIYALLRRWSRRRARALWLRVWVLLVAVTVAGAALQPVLIAPLFNRFVHMPNSGEGARVLALAARAGIPASHIYEVNASRQSAHTNAYVTGIFGTKRIVVYDTMLQSQTPAELDFVLGHEMGHYVLHHVAKGIAFAALLLFFGLWATEALYLRALRGAGRRRAVRGLDDVAGLPLLLLILAVIWFFVAPVANTVSRHIEHDADAFGLRLTPEPCAAVASFETEERTDLIWPNPPEWVVIWFYDHPSQQQRIAFARQFCPEK